MPNVEIRGRAPRSLSATAPEDRLAASALLTDAWSTVVGAEDVSRDVFGELASRLAARLPGATVSVARVSGHDAVWATLGRTSVGVAVTDQGYEVAGAGAGSVAAAHVGGSLPWGVLSHAVDAAVARLEALAGTDPDAADGAWGGGFEPPDAYWDEEARDAAHARAEAEAPGDEDVPDGPEPTAWELADAARGSRRRA